MKKLITISLITLLFTTSLSSCSSPDNYSSSDNYSSVDSYSGSSGGVDMDKLIEAYSVGEARYEAYKSQYSQQ